MSDLLRTEYELELEVADTRFHVAAFMGDFGLNDIPRAMCVLAVGRLAPDGTTAAKIHAKLNSLGHMQPAKVFVRLTGQWSSRSNWPDDEFLAFEGRLTGIGLQKDRGTLKLTAHLIHWLADLNFSSALGEQTHPNNPAQYTFQAALGAAVTTGAALQGFGVAQSSEGKSITADKLATDMWGNSIKPMLCAISEVKHIRVTGLLSACVTLKKGGNEQALAALKRIEGASELKSACDRPLSCYTPKLAIHMPDGGTNLALGYAISQMFRKDSIESYAYTTLWGKLVGSYASSLMFAVVPLVNTALVVPFLPGTRGLYCKEILADDYDHIDLNCGLNRPLRAVVVYAGKENKTGVLDADGRSPVQTIGMGGCYQPEDAEEDGMMLVVPGPDWLTNVISSGFSPLRTSGIAAGSATSSATTPMAIKDEIKGDEEGKSRTDRVHSTAEVYDRYAQSLFVAESLRGRLGALSGKLRFDIAPGATVRIEGTHEQFLEGRDQLGQNLVAVVARVSVGINSESARAGTGFQLSHIRTEAENKSDKMSVVGHPLYTTIFKGAPLIDRLLFPEGSNCTVNPDGDDTACRG